MLKKSYAHNETKDNKNYQWFILAPTKNSLSHHQRNDHFLPITYYFLFRIFPAI